MKIIIQTPRLTVRPSLISFVRQKVAHLAGLSNSLQEARVTLKLNKAEAKDSKTCEILGVIRGNDVLAEKKADSFDQAVTRAVEAVKRQLTEKRTSGSSGTVNELTGVTS